ncbi:hypothetical protein DAPPUDRAFT_332591 [Daphnia pulex]|uniref:Uncharacterized protein n=1 Tax=Daphnia pulex TaxID=6669 RepID=E9HQD2_DAPPU|nr:hypothetical protein DAPPUDRAFT_332591 [Daphnia pulex]|eukprot:EFX66050.1 hypothetical protein DAPPUDRAFT_332591 [Daphnia pulex]
MSGRDLLKDSLARHRARTKAEKRKNDALQKEQEVGRDRNVNQPDEVVTVSNQEVASEITPSNERSGVQDTIHSVALEQDIIEASILQFNKKKKEANQENFCSKCDMITHRKLVLHNREVCENGENLKFLRQNEFISEDGYITVEVSLPVQNAKALIRVLRNLVQET